RDDVGSGPDGGSARSPAYAGPAGGAGDRMVSSMAPGRRIVVTIHADAGASTAAGMVSKPLVPTRSSANSSGANSSRVPAAIPAAVPVATASVGDMLNTSSAIAASAIPMKMAGKTGPPRKPQPRHTP